MRFQSPSKLFKNRKNADLNIRSFLLIVFLFFSANIHAADLYSILGVPKMATLEEIKSAYRRLARRYHPDKNPNDQDAEAKMKEINPAYEILSDPASRLLYDQTGTASGPSISHSQRQWSEEEVRKYREQKDWDFAEKNGPKYSNAKWAYDPTSHKIFDSRTRKWLFVKDTYFRSDEGWLFHPSSGTYMSTDLRADWDPENDRGWYRRTSNIGDNVVLIDPDTGFPRKAIYAPGTVSNSSHLFEELMNPVNLLNFKSKRGNRSELMKDFDNLPWTESQIKDFIGRAKAHTTILARPDMKINFAGDQRYFNSAMAAVLDYEIVRQNPEIIIDFIKRAQDQYRSEISKELFMKEEWVNHKNSSTWLSELFRYPQGAKAYLEAAFTGDRSNPREMAARFKGAYLVMEKVGMDSATVDHVVGWLGILGADAYDVFTEEMKSLTYTKPFLELIATLDPQHTKNIQTFLAWYSTKDSRRAHIFEQTLNMPGTKWDDFWRLSADRTEFSLAESEYKAHKIRTSTLRLRFMDANLPKSEPISPSAHGTGLSCSKFYAHGS